MRSKSNPHTTFDTFCFLLSLDNRQNFYTPESRDNFCSLINVYLNLIKFRVRENNLGTLNNDIMIRMYIEYSIYVYLFWHKLNMELWNGFVNR